MKAGQRDASMAASTAASLGPCKVDDSVAWSAVLLVASKAEQKVGYLVV